MCQSNSTQLILIMMSLGGTTGTIGPREGTASVTFRVQGCTSGSHNHVTRVARARGYARASTRCVRSAASSEAKPPEEGIGSCLRKRPKALCICCKSVVEREMDEGVLTPRMTSKCGGTASCVLQDKVARVALLELPRGAEVSRW